jgi:hypothetical protein
MVWGWVTLCWATHITWVSAMGCLTIRSRPNSKANGVVMLKHLFPLFWAQKLSNIGTVSTWMGDRLMGLCSSYLQGNSWTAVGLRCCVTSWGIDPMHCTTPALWSPGRPYICCERTMSGVKPCKVPVARRRTFNQDSNQDVRLRFKSELPWIPSGVTSSH